MAFDKLIEFINLNLKRRIKLVHVYNQISHFFFHWP